MTHQSRDRGVTGASPDVSLALPLSAGADTQSGTGEVTTGNFLFDQLIGTGPILQFNSKHMQRKVPRWAPLCIYMEHTCCNGTQRYMSKLCVDVVVFSLHLHSLLLTEDRERDEMRRNKCRRREAALSSILPVRL